MQNHVDIGPFYHVVSSSNRFMGEIFIRIDFFQSCPNLIWRIVGKAQEVLQFLNLVLVGKTKKLFKINFDVVLGPLK